MKLIKSFSLYTTASFIEKGISFFLLPLFTFYLSTTDFGVLALLTSISSFVLPLVALGIQGAISVAYFKGERENYPSYFTSSIVPPFVTTIVLTLLALVFQSYLSNYFELPAKWVIVIPFFSFLSFFNSLLLIDYQIKDQPLKYVCFSLANSITNIAFSLLLVMTLKYGYEGRLYGQYLSALIFSLIAFLILFRKKLMVKDISKINIKDSLLFGLPLVPHIFGSMVVNMSDRMFIDRFFGKEALGVYNIGYVLGSAISILCAAFANAIIPFSYDLFVQDTLEAKAKVVKVYWLFIGVMIFSLLCLWLMTPLIFKWFIDAKFAEGARYVIWIALGYFFQGIYLLFANIIFYLKKTKILFYMSFVNIIVNLGLNFLLVPRLGPIGAAYTLCISYFIFFLTVAIYCQKLFPLPWLSYKNKE